MGTTTVLIGGGVHDSVVGGIFTVDPVQYWSKVYGSKADLHWSLRFVAEQSEQLSNGPRSTQDYPRWSW